MTTIFMRELLDAGGKPRRDANGRAMSARIVGATARSE
jgi:hypothetical protein